MGRVVKLRMPILGRWVGGWEGSGHAEGEKRRNKLVHQKLSMSLSEIEELL